jgi:O-antigen ligase
MTVIKKHPWFGSGFGTSVSGQSTIDFEFTRSRFIESRMVREHGNSYLAIMEWSGLLGVFPFYLLVLVTAWQAKRALSQLRRSGNIASPAVPAAAVIIAGVIGAGFEDWLFAVGYYVSVFFWVMAFILTDLLPAPMSSVQENELAASDAPFAVPVGAQ